MHNAKNSNEALRIHINMANVYGMKFPASRRKPKHYNLDFLRQELIRII